MTSLMADARALSLAKLSLAMLCYEHHEVKVGSPGSDSTVRWGEVALVVSSLHSY